METRLTRFEDWPVRLASFIEGAEKRPFLWGEWDCCLLAADWVLAATGFDAAADFRGKYATAAGARRLIKKHGDMLTMVRSLTEAHGMREINPKMAQRGDVCLVESIHGDALGVCIGARIACAGIDGLTDLPMPFAKAAWRV